ncbi:MAG: sugar isomerase domain-containing protein [Bacteroidota bacterium]
MDYELAYLSFIKSCLTRVQAEELDLIEKAGDALGGVIARGGVFHVFGSGHSSLIAMDCFQRAGSFAAANLIVDPTDGKAERIEGYGRELVAGYDLREGEVLIVISNSGRNPLPIEVAMCAKEKGLTVIAITSRSHSSNVLSRHSSGRRLMDIADIVLDNFSPPGDTCIEIPGLGEKVGPISTVVGSFILNLILIHATAYCVEHEVVPPILVSQNIDGTDQRNKELLSRYKHRIGAV